MSQIDPEIVEFGPYRVIGLSCIAKNENGEFAALWGGENGFVSRMSEVKLPEGDRFSVGLCRCVPGVTDGSFEYVAASPATADAPIPDGMIEARISACKHAVFTVNGLAEIMAGWEQVGKWLASQSEWATYCTVAEGGECDCVNHPFFELYPSDFGTRGVLYIYVPIKSKS
jgi:predicted transcriptional regulator YdeE